MHQRALLAKPTSIYTTKTRMHLYELPEELLLIIISHVSLPERLVAREVSRKMKSVVESQLQLLRSLRVSGRSLKSVLDFVKDSKAKEIPCPLSKTCHRMNDQDCLNKIIHFDRVCLLISRYFPFLVSLRFYRLTITYAGLQLLMQSRSWKSVQHVVIRSCCIEDGFEGFMDQHEDAGWWESVQPVSLVHMFYFPISHNASLIQVIRLMLKDYKCETDAGGWIKYTKREAVEDSESCKT